MRVALGVSGGVAAYKAAELVRRLQQEGIDVQVVMTKSAQEFITPLTFAALTGQKVITEMFGDESAGANVESAIEHIAVAQRIDLLVVAPATANVIAKMARGIADDFLTTLYLATTAPVVVAPAMNVNMWEHAATQENVEMLRARGVHVVPPEEGYLACGMTGAGRLASVDAIAQRRVRAGWESSTTCRNETIIVTAGPTCEDLDPVRFLTNRSSGKDGLCAGAGRGAARRARDLDQRADAARSSAGRRIRFRAQHRADAPRRARTFSARHRADHGGGRGRLPARCAADEKNEARERRRLTLELESTPDILADVARGKGDRIIIGFAAETDHVARARARQAGIEAGRSDRRQ